jgi:uncharacterized OB-fold protein
MEAFAGRSLREHALAHGEVLTTSWRVKAEYAWDTGVAVGRFLQGLKEGVILGIRCSGCRRTLIPPRAFCELCFKPLHEWVELNDTGVINTFSISYVNWDASRRETPEIPAVIEIDGASAGMGILHMLGEVDGDLEGIRERVKIGARVQAVWKPPQEREGSITDIKYFRLME